MKFNLLLVLIVALFSNVALSQDGHLHSSHYQKPAEGLQVLLGEDFSKPLLSPNLRYALATRDGIGGLYLIDLHTNKVSPISEDIASSYGYSWNYNSEYFYYMVKGKNEFMSQSDVYTYSISEGKSYENRDDISSLYLPSFKGIKENSESEIIVYTDIINLEVMAVDLVTRKEWKVTDGKRKYFSPIISHDQTKVAALSEDGVYVIPVNGGEAIKVGDGLATEWSEDDQYLLGFEDYSADGHEMTKSDIYLYDANKFAPRQLTNTEDVFEVYPNFYKDNQLICSDDRSGKVILINYKK